MRRAILAQAGMYALFLLLLAGSAMAIGEMNDSTNSLSGLDMTDAIVIATSVLAIILGAISAVAYARDGRTKLLFVTLAFFIFALKGVFIIGSDLLSLQQPFLDIIANLLDFVVLLCFFFGMMKK